MALNIKNESVARLARELACLTGETLTEAVRGALEARLIELRRQRARDQIARRIRELGQKCASQAPSDWLARDHDQELYGRR